MGVGWDGLGISRGWWLVVGMDVGVAMGVVVGVVGLGCCWWLVDGVVVCVAVGVGCWGCFALALDEVAAGVTQGWGG